MGATESPARVMIDELRPQFLDEIVDAANTPVA